MREFAPLIVTVIVALIGSGGFWTFIQYREEKKNDKCDKLDTLLTSIEDISNRVVKIEETTFHNRALSLAISRDRINFLCNKYMTLGYIPKDEYVSFKEIGDAYLSAGGNSEVKTKFNLVKDYEVK